MGLYVEINKLKDNKYYDRTRHEYAVPIAVADWNSVEAKPIVHAHWVYNNDDEPYCSKCGHRANLSSFEYFARDKIRFDDSLYCHFCGACMDEVIV